MANPSSNLSTAKPKSRSLITTVAIYAVLFVLLYFALRNAPFAEIWNALKNLKLWQICLILLLNAFVITCMTARWWIIVRAENPSMPFLPMVRYRLSVFGLSYFTPGPQVGGEPLQIIYLQRNHGITFARATSAVIMDKLLEFLVNFVLIGIGAWAIVKVGLISGSGIRLTLSLIGLGALLILPLAYIILLHMGIHPLAKILKPLVKKTSKATRLIVVAEQMASIFCRKHVRSMFLAIMVSFAALAGIALEYYLMVSFLGMNINAIQVFAALTAMQIAFLMPLPGGLGALEASQVFALGAFGQPASAAISLTLLMRARDTLNGGIGLLLAGRGIAK
ncbi:MAG: flippase-like domain-containing protein [Anaerolineales bacterium]|nr:flippase-like domain-containing protein [Anaerolineales bacterium]HNQ96292.1 lysylphosphatidylglycerol synthase transmembrane domain-containing protein [Anaerolineales bacterium]